MNHLLQSSFSFEASGPIGVAVMLLVAFFVLSPLTWIISGFIQTMIETANGEPLEFGWKVIIFLLTFIVIAFLILFLPFWM